MVCGVSAMERKRGTAATRYGVPSEGINEEATVTTQDYALALTIPCPQCLVDEDTSCTGLANPGIHAERLESAEFVRQINAILDEKAVRGAAVSLLKIDAGAVALKDGLV